ncbi:unnamed protein product [Polarella glacialis]|uniref:Fe2OG dioxygenase domain-containing protein n=1 Tax=Polarella glacialis TaxID=89957 RepID=A0A813DBE3_POLGL|nr:unnamed protein product [Polarella glacialis]
MGGAAAPQTYCLLQPRLPATPLEELLAPELWRCLASGTGRSGLGALARREFEDVFSVPLFGAAFCEQLVREAESFRSWASGDGRRSPGLLLGARWYPKHMDESFEGLFGKLLNEVLVPLDAALFGEKAPLAYHHDYCICFEDGADRALKAHTDDSDVTVNVFLGTGSGSVTHTGAELLLLDPTEEDTRCGTPRLNGSYKGRSFRYNHEEVGRAVIHRGSRWHAVLPLESGCRWNLVTWALRADSEWKRSFYTEMDQQLLEKAQHE